MGEVDKEVKRCVMLSCAQPVRVGIIRWEARYPGAGHGPSRADVLPLVQSELQE